MHQRQLTLTRPAVEEPAERVTRSIRVDMTVVFRIKPATMRPIKCPRKTGINAILVRQSANASITNLIL